MDNISLLQNKTLQNYFLGRFKFDILVLYSAEKIIPVLLFEC